MPWWFSAERRRPDPPERRMPMADVRWPESIAKLRRSKRLVELEVDAVADACLAGSGVRRVLDIGTGSGVFAEVFAGRGIGVVGLDPDPEMILAARRLVPTVPFLVGSAEQLPVGVGCCDLAFMGMVLHETADPRLALTEARRATAGRLAVLEWPPTAPEDPPPPARRFAEGEVEEMAAASGFAEARRLAMRRMILYVLS
jgi:ubiquinone/menaquinone biosynthesis C-methylase UbiE